MNLSHKFKHALFALGFGVTAAAVGLTLNTSGCGGDNTTPDMGAITFTSNISKDVVTLGCTVAGCHSGTVTSQMFVFTGTAATDYNTLVSMNLIVKGSPSTSPLIQVPSTGMAPGGASHVKTLTGTTLTNWTSWIQNGAPQ